MGEIHIVLGSWSVLWDTHIICEQCILQMYIHKCLFDVAHPSTTWGSSDKNMIKTKLQKVLLDLV